MRTLLLSSIRNIIALLGQQEGDDALWDCHRFYFGERELMIGDADVNVIMTYPDDLLINADEGGIALYASSMTDIELQTLYNGIVKVASTSQELMDYIDTLGYTRESILRGARRDGEKPMGYLLTSLRDHTGLPKRGVWKAAEYMLNKFEIKNEKQ